MSPGALGWTLAWRYLRRRRVAWLAVVSVVLAVLIGFVPGPVMDGFLALLRKNLRATAAEVTVEILGLPDDDPGLRDRVAATLRATPGIAAVARRADGLVGLTTLSLGQAIAGAQLAGIDPAAEAKVTPFRDFLLHEYELPGGRFPLTDRDHPFELTASVRDFDLRWRRACYEAGAAAHGAQFVALIDQKAEATIVAQLGGMDMAEPEDWAEARHAAVVELGETELVKHPLEQRLQLVRAADPDGPGERWSRAAAVQALQTAWNDAVTAHREAAGGAERLPGLVIGHELMRRWPRIRPGAVVDLYTASLDGASGEVHPSNRAFVVTGVYQTNFYEWDERFLYTDFATARSFLAGSRIAETWVCKTADADQAAEFARRAKQAVMPLLPVPPGLTADPERYRSHQVKATTWRAGKETFLRAVESQKGVLLGLLRMGLFISGISIAVTLWVLVTEKSRDIGILASMGVAPLELLRVFVGTGVLLAVLGTGLGLVLGVVVLENADAIVRFAAGLGFDVIDVYVHDVQHLQRIPVQYDWGSAAWIALLMCCSAVIFSFIPAIRASVIDPVKAIRR